MRSIISLICITALLWCAQPLQAQHRAVTMAEYFWDLDPGAGNGTPLLAADGTFDQALEAVFANPSNLPNVGIHRLGIRVRAANGSWSPVFSQIVEIMGSNNIMPAISVTMAEYFWDIDPGMGNGTPLLAFNGNFDEAVETAFASATAPSLGIHTFSIRMADNSGDFGPVFTTVVEVEDIRSIVRNIKITAAECFWDTDPGQGNGTPLIALNGNFDEALEQVYDAIGTPTVGLHKFHIRLQDEDGIWGPTFQSIVEITPATNALSSQNYIAAAEYFWDTDPGAGNGQTLLAFNGNFDEALERAIGNGAPSAIGMHKLGIRMKDSQNHWGKAFTIVVEVTTNNTVTIPVLKIATAEFFWDNDPGKGNGTQMTAINGNFAKALETALATAPAPNTVGYHKLFVRVKDNANQWGPTFASVIEVLPNTPTTMPVKQMTGAEYFFDYDPGNGNATPMLAFDGNFNSVIEKLKGGSIPSPITAGYHTLYMRTNDAANNWGKPFGIVVYIDTTIGFTAQINGPTSLCPAAFAGVAYNAAPILGSTYQWQITGGTIVSGNGTANVTVNWAANGPYQLSLIQCIGNGAFCDTANLVFSVSPYTTISSTQTICQGQTVWGYGNTGTFRDTISSTTSCDTIRVLNLTVLPKAAKTVNATVCYGQQYQGYTTSGTYQNTYVAANGCDSVRTLILTVKPYSGSSISQTVCFGQAYLGYNASGTYRDTFTNSQGCDSIRTLQLTVRPQITQTINQTICQGQSYLGRSASGIYRDTLVSSSGCDSIRILNLSVLPSQIYTVSRTLCYGGFYQNYNTSGTYTDTFRTAGGCDSIRVLYLTVLPKVADTVNITLCQGYNYNGYTTSGTYIDTISAANGCDSIRTLNLTILPTSATNITTMVCYGSSFAGYTATGVYTDTLRAANGCDSVRTINLTVRPRSATIVAKTICSGQNYLGYSATGTYVDTFTAANGCDSIRTLNLTVWTVPITTISQNVCYGDSYLGYNQTGVYRDTFAAANGCDSVRVISLTIRPQNIATVNITACQGDVVSGYTATGTYVDTLVDRFGCDSIRTLNLTIVQTQLTLNKQRICQGDSIKLGNVWYYTAGTFNDTIINASGCFDITTTILEVNQLPTKPVITLQGSTLSTTSGYTTYQWYRNGSIINDVTGDTLPNAAPGIYTVQVTNITTCATTSDAFEVLQTGVENVGNNWDVKFYPNPTSGVVYVTLENAPNAKLQLFSSVGQLLYESELDGSQTISINLSMYAQGMYILRAETGKEVITKKITKTN